MPSISPILAWFLVGIAFFVFELAVPGFIIFFFGIGAWCTALAVYLSDVPLSGQLVVFLVTSLITLFLPRKGLSSLMICHQICLSAWAMILVRIHTFLLTLLPEQRNCLC